MNDESWLLSYVCYRIHIGEISLVLGGRTTIDLKKTGPHATGPSGIRLKLLRLRV